MPLDSAASGCAPQHGWVRSPDAEASPTHSHTPFLQHCSQRDSCLAWGFVHRPGSVRRGGPWWWCGRRRPRTACLPPAWPIWAPDSGTSIKTQSLEVSEREENIKTLNIVCWGVLKKIFSCNVGNSLLSKSLYANFQFISNLIHILGNNSNSQIISNSSFNSHKPAHCC